MTHPEEVNNPTSKNSKAEQGVFTFEREEFKPFVQLDNVVTTP